MIRCADPFEAMSVANGLLVSSGVHVHESDWAPSIISYECTRRYDNGVHYEITILLTAKGFRAVYQALPREVIVWSTYTVQSDPHVRVQISIGGILHLLALVTEEEVDEIMAL